jgi:hypothetical protein
MMTGRICLRWTASVVVVPLWPTSRTICIVGDLGAVTDVVGLTVAEFIPRQVMHLHQLLTSFPCYATRH